MTPDQIVQLLNLAAGIGLPVLVGWVTTRLTDSWIKAVLLATLALASGIVGQLIANGGIDGFDWFTALINGGGAWLVAVATYFGVWKPTGVSESLQSRTVTGRHVID